MRAVIILLVTIFIGANCLLAQSASERAKALYYEAVDLNNNGSYAASNKKLNEAQVLLGASNLRIQYLKVKNHYALNELEKTKVEILAYLKFDPENDAYFKEVMSIKRSIEEKEALVQQKIEDEKKLWTQAETKNTKEAYDAYLKAYPQGMYTGLAKQKSFFAGFFNRNLLLKEIDKERYLKLTNEEKMTLLNEYINRGYNLGIVSVMLDGSYDNEFAHYIKTNHANDYATFIGQKHPFLLAYVFDWGYLPYLRKEVLDYVRNVYLNYAQHSNTSEELETYLKFFPETGHKDDILTLMRDKNISRYKDISIGELKIVSDRVEFKKLTIHEKAMLLYYYAENKKQDHFVHIYNDKEVAEYAKKNYADSFITTCIDSVNNTTLEFLLKNSFHKNLSKPVFQKLDAYIYKNAGTDDNKLKEYLNNFPNGAYIQKAKEQLEANEDAFYQQALKKNSSNAMKDYLSTYIKGRYELEARKRYYELKDEEDFEVARKLNSSASYDVYAKKNPNGKYYSEVIDKYETRLYEESQGSVTMLTKYTEEFPNGKYTAAAKKEIAKLKFKNFLSAPDDFYNLIFLNYYYNSISPVGINVLEMYWEHGFGFYVFTKFKPLMSMNDETVTLKPDGSYFDGYRDQTYSRNEFTIAQKTKNFYIGGGITHHLVSIFYGYAGIGVGSEKTVHYIFDRPYFVPELDERKFNYLVDVGLSIYLHERISAKVGITSYGMKQHVPTFGIAWNVYD